MNRFKGKTVVITGSGTGIGQAIARKFAEEGANIVIMGRRKEPLENTKLILENIIKNVNSDGKVRMFAGVDVSDEEGIKNMFDTIYKEFGGVDIVVNNAGVSGPIKSLPAQPFNEFKECVSIHLTGTFRTSIHALKYMREGSKIITITTYFTEERPYEQRPYRFRTPYTAAQGAKNRLVEALAWELAKKGIRFIATNPGPVHSDRIYKTVYPKAAAEFVRIGGFEGLRARDIEKIIDLALPFLGEVELESAINKVAYEISKERSSNVEEIKVLVKKCLDKIQELAEKIQNNTRKMIVDGEFLTQEEIAEIVLNLAEDNISRLVNGRVIPADRVFYPVKPLVGCSIPNYKDNFSAKSVIITIGTNESRHIELGKKLAYTFKNKGANCIILLSRDNDPSILNSMDIHAHVLDLTNEEVVRRILKIASNKFGKPDLVLHLTGNYDYERELTTLTREEWDRLVDRYINVPALITKESINIMVPDGRENPSAFKNSNGTIIIIGPDAPRGNKISGIVRARAEIFRGALRPFTATVNQELENVLNSNIRVYLLLPGSMDGKEPNDEKLINACLALTSERTSEVIYYVDE